MAGRVIKVAKEQLISYIYFFALLSILELLFNIKRMMLVMYSIMMHFNSCVFSSDESNSPYCLVAVNLKRSDFPKKT